MRTLDIQILSFVLLMTVALVPLSADEPRPAAASRPAPINPTQSGSRKNLQPPVVISKEKFEAAQVTAAAKKGDSSSSGRTSSPYKTEFYGVQAAGKRFVFVIDNSTSMLDGGRLGHVHEELMRTIGNLKWPQGFYVIAFDRETVATPWGPFISAGSDEARKLRGWLGRLVPKDGTFPGPALKQAVGLKPEAIFFLTDGEFESPTPTAIKAWNSSGVPIHVIDFNPGPEVSDLRRIATDSGGVYRKGR